MRFNFCVQHSKPELWLMTADPRATQTALVLPLRKKATKKKTSSFELKCYVCPSSELKADC